MALNRYTQPNPWTYIGLSAAIPALNGKPGLAIGDIYIADDGSGNTRQVYVAHDVAGVRTFVPVAPAFAVP